MTMTRQTLALTVNGEARTAEAPTHWTLLQLLRDGLQLGGTKEGCGEGACGSCTVLVDGSPVRSCLYLAVRAAGRHVETVEGLARGGQMHPCQAAFVDQGAIQCGFCTPGFLMVTRALLADHPQPTEADVREYLSGNLCRCGGYPFIIRAVLDAAARSGS